MQKSLIQTEHLGFLFDTIIAKLNGKLHSYPKEISDFDAPLFVTWYIGKEKHLRGCIGTFQSNLMSKHLGKYANISAFNDDRFGPIRKEELASLTANLSILFNFQKRKNWNDFEIGKNGITIQFEIKGRYYNGTYLPEVMVEQKWNHEQTIESLVKKAGYKGSYKEVLDLIELETYESEKKSMGYDEYLQKFGKN